MRSLAITGHRQRLEVFLPARTWARPLHLRPDDEAAESHPIFRLDLRGPEPSERRQRLPERPRGLLREIDRLASIP